MTFVVFIFFFLNNKTVRDSKLKLDLGLFSFMTLEHCFVNEIIFKKQKFIFLSLYFSSEVHLCEQELQEGFGLLIFLFLGGLNMDE